MQDSVTHAVSWSILVLASWNTLAAGIEGNGRNIFFGACRVSMRVTHLGKRIVAAETGRMRINALGNADLIITKAMTSYGLEKDKDYGH